MHYKPTEHSNKKFYYWITLIAILIFFIGGISYYLLKNRFNQSHDQTIPFIKANDMRPIKVKPDQSLNPKLPHADKMIYNEMDNQAALLDQVKQNMLDLPEEPIVHQEEVIPSPLEETNMETIATEE